MKRRLLLAGAASQVLAAPQIAGGADARVLKFVPQANVSAIDPVWTTAIVTRNHAYMIYDTLYGMDSALAPHPQMAAGHVVESGGLAWTITLRDGLLFHDGEKVRARDAVASAKRWMRRNPFGQKLATVTDEVVALDDVRLRFRLNKPFPLLAHALGTAGQPCYIMPERLALTDPFKAVTDPTGSGPFRFNAREYNSGSLIVYERHAGYVPRPDGTADLTAGPKVVNFDRVEWQVITDAATAAAALQAGEIDWFEQPPAELQPLFRGREKFVLDAMDPRGTIGVMRPNFLHPPFDDVAVRRALLHGVKQSDFMTAVSGTDPDAWRDDVGIFTPGGPMANDAGIAAVKGSREPAMVAALLKQAGYRGERIRLIGPTDILAPSAMTQVAGDLLQRMGFNLDIALSDWGTVIQRRTVREPVERNGWSVLNTGFSSFEMADPAAHPLIRGNGAEAWFGWPTLPQLETLRDAWFDAPDVAAQKAICRDIQTVAFDQVPYVPLGVYFQMTAYDRRLTGRLPGLPIFWNLRRV